MKIIFITWLALQAVQPECAASLKLRGVGQNAARHVQSYATCLNSMVGTAQQLRASCNEARSLVLSAGGTKAAKAKIDRAVRWLDAMVRERASCETRLQVEA